MKNKQTTETFDHVSLLFQEGYLLRGQAVNFVGTRNIKIDPDDSFLAPSYDEDVPRLGIIVFHTSRVDVPNSCYRLLHTLFRIVLTVELLCV